MTASAAVPSRRSLGSGETRRQGKSRSGAPSPRASASGVPDTDDSNEPARGFGPLTLLATIAVALTTIVTAISYCRIFPDWSFLGPMVATLVLVHVSLAICRWFHRGLLVSWLIALVTLAVAIGLFYFPDTLAVIVPTRATWDAAWQSIADSFVTFQSTVAPVPSDGGFALAACGGLALVAIVSDTFAFRAFGRVESVIPAALMFVVAASLGVDRNRIAVTAVWLAVAVLAVALLRAAHSESTVPWLGTGQAARTSAVTGGAAALALGAIVGGVVLGPRLPGADAEPIINTRNSGGSSSTIVSPMVSVQARLVNRSNVELFTVRADGDSYWRLTALPKFDGKNWGQASKYDSSLGDAFEGTGTTTVTQEFRIAELGEVYVPAAFSISDVQSTEALDFDAETSTLIRRDKLFTGMTYVVQSAVPSYTADELRSATVGQDVSSDYLDLPSDFPDELMLKAQEVAGGQPTPYDQALALQNWFRAEFTYNVNVPRGSGTRVMETFINSREGYCEQFSATFAAFARVLGIPSRVVVGFTPGDRDDDGLLHVRGKHTHAWPEVYFDGLGWVPFEPTPGRGAPGAEGYTGVQAAQDGGVLSGPADTPTDTDKPRTTNGSASPPTSRAPTLPTIPQTERDPRKGPGGSTKPTAEINNNSVPRPLVALGLLLGALGLWLVAMAPLARLLSKRRVGADPAARVTDAWSRSAASLGLIDAGRSPDETPIEHANRAWHMAGIDQKLLADLASAATRATYAAESVDTSTAQRCEDDAQRVARLVRRRATKSRLLAARFNPRTASQLP
jgi:transglutaminase-like putative cysteine protease